MSLNLNPWFALLLGILIGWVLEWLFELWFFRRRRLECQRRLANIEAQLRARDEELRREQAKVRLLEDQLATSRAAAAAASAAVTVAAPEVKAELPAVEVEAPEVKAELPAVEVAVPEVKAELPAVEVETPEVEVELPAVEVEAPEVKAELPAVEIEAPDDLLLIQGIGSVYAAKLRAAGITTFAQLADTDSARLAAIIQAPSWRKVDYEAWREQARLAAAGDLASLQAGQAAAAEGGDDLTLIVGVGDKTAAVLKKAGITSFDELAETSPEQLDEVIKQAGLRPGDYAAWIAQARLLSGKRSRGIAELVACPQDLSKVKGISSTYETRLYEAGIGTFWELANTDDAELSRILGIKDFQKVDLAAIKAAARSLAEETGTVGRGWSGTPPDDFEPLQGIGPVFEGRLYDAGICTYEALANATVEQLAEICKAPTWRMPDYAGWIAQAKELLAQRGR